MPELSCFRINRLSITNTAFEVTGSSNRASRAIFICCTIAPPVIAWVHFALVGWRRSLVPPLPFPFPPPTHTHHVTVMSTIRNTRAPNLWLIRLLCRWGSSVGVGGLNDWSLELTEGHVHRSEGLAGRCEQEVHIHCCFTVLVFGMTSFLFPWSTGHGLKRKKDDFYSTL